MFRDRQEAGRRLAAELEAYRSAADTIVLGIPRGGVVVAAQVAHALDLPLDIAVAAKVGAPGNPEYAIGAVAPDGEVTPNPSSGFSASEVKRLSGDAHAKVDRYQAALRGDRAPVEIAGKTILLVDDGLATGLTAHAAVEWLKRQRAREVIVAVPVASSSAVESVGRVADRVIAVDVPLGFYAVGQFYDLFTQTEDDEVVALLHSAPIPEVRS